MKITVIGLGYVGLVSSVCLANKGFTIAGLDIDESRINNINKGTSPIIEKGLNKLLTKAIENEKFQASKNYKEALSNSSISLICVGTPVVKNHGELDQKNTYILNSLEASIIELANNLKYAAKYHVIAVRSTIPPSTLQNLIIPLLEKHSGKKYKKDFGVCFNPEFLREGVAIKDFNNPPMTIIGTDDTKTFEIMSKMYSWSDKEVLLTDFETSEIVKMVSNAFHALKVVFANEIGRICKEYHIDSHVMMDLICKDTILNISPAYLKPGFAFGGSCLPKDLSALIGLSKNKQVDVPLLESILPSNNSHIKKTYEIIKKQDIKKIGFLGISFKEGTNDLRYSAKLTLLKDLFSWTDDISIYDENVWESYTLEPENPYYTQEIPHVIDKLNPNIVDVISSSEILIIGNKDIDLNILDKKLLEDKVIVDLEGHLKNTDLGKKYIGLCW